MVPLLVEEEKERSMNRQLGVGLWIVLGLDPQRRNTRMGDEINSDDNVRYSSRDDLLKCSRHRESLKAFLDSFNGFLLFGSNQ